MLKKALLASAIAASLPMSAMAVGPIDGKVYGKINLTVDSEDYSNGGDATQDSDQWEVNSNASRIGVKGKAELSEGLYAIYKAEFEMYVDDGVKGKDNNDTFSQRNTYVGLTGGFGTIFAGKHDSPTKLAQKKIDLFNDLGGDIKNTFEGENRADNVVVYATPKMSGFQATAGFIASEGDDVDGDNKGDDGFDGTSLSVSYSMDNLYLALAADRDVDGLDLERFVAQYKMDALQLGFMYQDAEAVVDSTHANYKEEDGYFVSAKYKIDRFTLKAQYGEVEGEDENNADYEEETFSIGVDYKLAKKTKAMVYYTKNTDDQTDNTEDETKIFGIGLEHKF